MKKLIVTCDTKGIEIAVQTIQEGGIVVFPTDTVYGIGCDPYNLKAVKSIYKFKKRDESKFLPVLGYSKKELSRIAIFEEKANKIADKFWPGGLTLVLKIKDKKIKQSLNLENKIAVRVPNNNCALSLLKRCKLLVGTSANLSGTTSFKDPQKCLRNTTGFDVFIDGGKIMSKGESTIIEMDNGLKVIRQGIVSRKEIMDIF